MKKNKLFTSVLLTIAIMLSVITPAFAAIPEYGEEYANQPSKSYNVVFKDVDESNWAFSYIMEMNERGVLAGYPNGYFYPDNTITRAEFSKVMCLAAGVTVTPVYYTSYTDVNENEWYAPYVEAGKYYLSGYVSDGEKYYMPDDNALREDIAVALVKLKGYDTSIYDESILKIMFKDWQSISQGARKYVAIAVENDLISGYEDHTFRGQATITRAEAATLLWRAYQYGNGNKIFEKEEFETPSTTEPENESIYIEEEYAEPEESEVEEPELLELSLDIDKTKFTVENGETVTVVVNVKHNLEGEFVPSVFDIDGIIESLKTEDNGSVTKTTFKTTELKTGRYELDFSIEDDSRAHSQLVLITVKEPEPEYSYEVSTVVSNVTDVDSMIGLDNGIMYLSEGKVMYVGKDDNRAKTLFDPSDCPYLGTEELTKANLAHMQTEVRGIVYNEKSNEKFCIIYQSNSRDGSKWYLYNLEINEIVGDIDSSLKYAKDQVSLIARTDEFKYCKFYMPDDNTILTTGYNIYTNKDRAETANSFANLSITEFFSSNGIYAYYNNSLYKYNERTGNHDVVDYFIPDCEYFLGGNSEYIYAMTSDNIIYRLDKDYNEEIFLFEGDIDNVDGKIINFDAIRPGTTKVDEEGNIFYWDVNYNCIRQISEK